MDSRLDFIRKRYDGLSRFYNLFEYLLLLPRGLRTLAVGRLEIQPSDRILEVGCGTGRNFPALLKAVGPKGHLYGVDASWGMLARARRDCLRRGWRNVTLILGDAAQVWLPGPFDGVIFSLSYSVIPDHREALRRAWAQLAPGKHLVVVDAKLPPGRTGVLLRPLILLVSRATVLGDPDRRPWEDLRELTDRIELWGVRRGIYFVCRGTKPPLRSGAPEGVLRLLPRYSLGG